MKAFHGIGSYNAILVALRRCVSSKQLAFVVAGVLMGITALGLAWRPHKVLATRPSSDALAADVSSSVQSPVRTFPLVLRFAVTDAVVLPREKHITQGPVSIYIEDYMGGATLGLARENGPELGMALRDVGSWRGKVDANLTPGRYVVYDMARSGNTATIVVDP